MTQTKPLARRPAAGALPTMSLDEVTDEAQDLPDRWLIYGPPGFGKTSLAAMWPKPVFVLTDDGLKTLIKVGRLPKTAHFPKTCETGNDVRLAVNELIVKDHEYRTLVVDTISGAEALYAEEVCQRKYGGSREKFDGFGGAGYKSVVPEWLELLELFGRLRERKRMGVVLLAHSLVRNEKNPQGSDYGKFAPSMHKAVAEPTLAWVDAVLAAQFETFTKEDKPGKVLGLGGERRVLRCTPNAAYEAKNRLGLPEQVYCGDSHRDAYEALQKALGRPEGGAE